MPFRLLEPCMSMPSRPLSLFSMFSGFQLSGVRSAGTDQPEAFMRWTSESRIGTSSMTNGFLGSCMNVNPGAIWMRLGSTKRKQTPHFGCHSIAMSPRPPANADRTKRERTSWYPFKGSKNTFSMTLRETSALAWSAPGWTAWVSKLGRFRSSKDIL